MIICNATGRAWAPLRPVTLCVGTRALHHGARKVESPRVIYRGAPYMRVPWFLLASASFALAGLNFATLIRDYLTWPLFPTKDKEPELVNAPARYTAAGGTLLISLLCSWYFMYAPSRMVTRLTVLPAQKLLVVRTAAPSAARILPSRIREMPFFSRAGTISTDDARDRIVHLADVFRLQGSAVGAEVNELRHLVKDGMTLPAERAAWFAHADPLVPRTEAQDTLLLRVADARLAFQLVAAPQRQTLLGEPPLGGVRKYFHLLLRAPTDWDEPAGYALPAAEKNVRDARLQRGIDTEPWFLDRTKFDQLFPLDRSRYRK